MLRNLQSEWYTLVRPFGAEQIVIEAIFDDMVAHYEAEKRFYHNLHHIGNVLTAVSHLKSYAERYEAILLAAWFHDVIYDVHANDNEAQSALYAKRVMAELNIPSEMGVFVCHLILATTHQSVPGSMDCKILLDADLATFASSPDEYEQYAKAIRQEYAFVPEETYRTVRKVILNRFLQRNRIYFTEAMFEQREAQARENIAKELAQLSLDG